MFKNGKNQPAPARVQRSGDRFSVIGADVTIHGNLTSGENLQVNGRIEGDLGCATLVQGPESVVVGNIAADEARLAGLVDGTVNARLVILAPSARVTGDVTYELLSIESGARVDGRFAHRDGAAASELTLQPEFAVAAE